MGPRKKQLDRFSCLPGLPRSVMNDGGGASSSRPPSSSLLLKIIQEKRVDDDEEERGQDFVGLVVDVPSFSSSFSSSTNFSLLLSSFFSSPDRL